MDNLKTFLALSHISSGRLFCDLPYILSFSEKCFETKRRGEKEGDVGKAGGGKDLR